MKLAANSHYKQLYQFLTSLYQINPLFSNKMKIKHLLFLIVLFFLYTDLSAQAYMVVRKKGTKRRYEYRAGSYLTYKQKGWDIYTTDRITELKDSTLVLENNLILIEQIESIDIQNAFTNRAEILQTAESFLPVIGYGLLALDLINHTVIDGNDFSLDPGTTTTSAALVLTGYSLKIFRRKKVHLTKPKFEAFIVE